MEQRDFDPQEFVDALAEIASTGGAMSFKWTDFHPFAVEGDAGTRRFSNLRTAALSALAENSNVRDMRTGQIWVERWELKAACQPEQKGNQ